MLLRRAEPGGSLNDPTYPDDPICETTYTIVGPLLKTEWEQDNGFNALAKPCTNDIESDRALSGCVAVAMGQVMKFHEYPNNYNWADMPNTTASMETALLLSNIGYAVNNIWGCERTDAEGSDIAPAFKNDFGYRSANFVSFNHFALENELRRYQVPVILTGHGNLGGHAWVCDGYIKVTNCTGTYSPVFSMNWGMKDGDFNGYYAYYNFSPGNATLNNYKEMIINIYP